jgi:hypothetical protein
MKLPNNAVTIPRKEKALRRGLEEFDCITVLGRHQRGKHFNLQRRDFGEEAVVEEVEAVRPRQEQLVAALPEEEVVLEARRPPALAVQEALTNTLEEVLRLVQAVWQQLLQLLATSILTILVQPTSPPTPIKILCSGSITHRTAVSLPARSISLCGTSRHFAAVQNLVATGAQRTWPDLLLARPGRE